MALPEETVNFTVITGYKGGKFTWDVDANAENYSYVVAIYRGLEDYNYYVEGPNAPMELVVRDLVPGLVYNALMGSYIEDAAVDLVPNCSPELEFSPYANCSMAPVTSCSDVPSCLLCPSTGCIGFDEYCPPDVPSPPANLSVSARPAAATTATIAWAAVPAAANGGAPILRYVVERARDAAFTTATKVLYEGMQTSAHTSNLTPGQTYFFRVAAVNVVGRSAWTVESFVVPNPCGNGVQDAYEECDDGDQVAGDGCSAVCTVEDGFVCLEEGEACAPAPDCGDGVEYDCMGLCGGFAVRDDCGVCAGGSSGKAYNADVDDCGVCGGGNATMSHCGVCLDVDPTGGVDACNVCFGDNSTCIGCDLVPNSGLDWDVCGECGGDNTSCVGCDGIPIPLGGSVYDKCGVCGGGNTTGCFLGCDGNVGGQLYDCMRVCGGAAVVDDCGVCTGGTSGTTFNANKDSCGQCFGSVDEALPDNCGSCYSVDACKVYFNATGWCSAGTCNCSDEPASLCNVCNDGQPLCAGCDGLGGVFDECGVCNGDNATCLGCDAISIFDGGKVFDRCGVCGGDGFSCLHACDVGTPGSQYDCAGVCAGTAFIDDCGLCVGGTTGLVANYAKDACGNCFGRNSARDRCGQCGGNDRSRDVCGICFGRNSSLDDCGVCHGFNRLKDVCGVCGGNESSCLGCDGIPFSSRVQDDCGVCGGNGGCLVVQDSDSLNQQTALQKTADLALIVGLGVGAAVVCACICLLLCLAKRRTAAIQKYKDEKAADAPRGRICIVFTSIQGASEMWEDYPDDMPMVIELHHHRARRLLPHYDGYEVKPEGDALMVVFSNAKDAVRWCCDLQVELLGCKWPERILSSPDCERQIDDSGKIIFNGPRVRMGVHVGMPDNVFDERSEKMDYYGPDVNRAARVMAQARGGQIIVSAEVLDVDGVAEMLRDDGYHRRELGSHMLKGLQSEMRLVEVLPSKLATRTFPLPGSESFKLPPLDKMRAPSTARSNRRSSISSLASSIADHISSAVRRSPRQGTYTPILNGSGRPELSKQASWASSGPIYDMPPLPGLFEKAADSSKEEDDDDEYEEDVGSRQTFSTHTLT